ncbi:GNAT family N-acetyltransferase [Streptomyces sp. NPDC056144]|uniref:GNAT family N-acetyltransferase n=1 Tax=unclassified Streptomyces TaxID=2593676 RepID=UPI0035DD6546
MTSPLAGARRLWEELAGHAGEFPPRGGVRVLVSPESRMCPPGWTGAVTLGGAALVTAPDARTAARVREALRGRAAEAAVDVTAYRERLPVAEVLGPAALAFLSPEGFRPVTAAAVERVPAEDPSLRALERAAGPQDAREASLEDITSPAFVLHEDGEPLAAAGYRLWPHRTAHIGVLTAPAARGRGLARTVASAAVAHALAAGLLPQWRARVPASRRVAAALGFEELGAQLSVRIGEVRVDEVRVGEVGVDEVGNA